ncbi:MAG: DegT/DnrJ/EryC1/StrS family aminotransferase, partial [Candidatus Altiarchaeota archaeon]|nr:DegT/DnrJ/EryC1/StrS family aminotransferase [Candidatus Altiarchaeota archaeon]
KYLSEKGIGYGIHYPRTMCEQPFYHKLGLSEPFEVADSVSGEVVSLPVHPALTQDDLDFICSALGDYKK